MQAVCKYTVFDLPGEHHDPRVEALHAHRVMNPDEARLGAWFFFRGLAVSALMLLGICLSAL